MGKEMRVKDFSVGWAPSIKGSVNDRPGTASVQGGGY